MPWHPFKRSHYPAPPAPCVAVIGCYGYSADAAVYRITSGMRRVLARRSVSA